jgi:hypothetical protein
MSNGWYWCSAGFATFLVQVDHDYIINAAPIVRKFIGQPFNNLLKWKNFDVVRLEN